MFDPNSQQLTWLSVGGCPRSGTTALGEALNRHPQIVLLHEFDQAHFFSTVRALFREEDRLGEYIETDQFELIPRRARHELPIIRGIIETVSGKQARIFGTKFPGLHLWPQPEFPPGICAREIHITRAPVSVVTSYVTKMHRESYPGTAEHIFDTALAHWISAWNHAVSRRGQTDFLHLRYEQVAGDESVARAIADFLGLDDSIDLSEFSSKDREASDCYAELEALGYGNQNWKLELLAQQWDGIRGVEQAEQLPLGFPIDSGEDISLCSDRSWKTVAKGFLPAEPEGAWVGSQAASVHFLPRVSARCYLVTMDVPWVFQHQDIPAALRLSIGTGPVIDALISLENMAGGEGRRFSWILHAPDDEQLSTFLQIVPLNPRNPKDCGIGSDDRLLSVMVRSVRITPL